ncbi:MAG: hypothetical protein JKY65_27830 [Planctomycetes bacterium]|nr:hypothetical protein [Planctomycetota bacterium]
MADQEHRAKLRAVGDLDEGLRVLRGLVRSGQHDEAEHLAADLRTQLRVEPLAEASRAFWQAGGCSTCGGTGLFAPPNGGAFPGTRPRAKRHCPRSICGGPCTEDSRTASSVDPSHSLAPADTPVPCSAEAQAMLDGVEEILGR